MHSNKMLVTNVAYNLQHMVNVGDNFEIWQFWGTIENDGSVANFFKLSPILTMIQIVTNINSDTNCIIQRRHQNTLAFERVFRSFINWKEFFDSDNCTYSFE